MKDKPSCSIHVNQSTKKTYFHGIIGKNDHCIVLPGVLCAVLVTALQGKCECAEESAEEIQQNIAWIG